MSQQAELRAEAPFLIKAQGKTITFMWFSTLKNPLKNSVDLRVKMRFSELLWLTKRLNCHIGNLEILPTNLDLYNRLLIYSSVRSTMGDRRRSWNLQTAFWRSTAGMHFTGLPCLGKSGGCIEVREVSAK